MIASSLNTGSQRMLNKQLMFLLNGLRDQVGITIESPPAVIAHYLQERMAALGVADLNEYLALLDGSIGARAEWIALSDLLTVKETRFFRQAAALDCVGEHVLGLLNREPGLKQLSFWSAGCSTGQELYSIAMVIEHLLRDYQPVFGWHGLGTDISFQALEQADRACYRQSNLQNVPEEYRNSYLEPLDGGQWQVTENIRSRTDFVQNNLMQVDRAVFDNQDIIFCQNVLIYFERKKQQWIIDQFVERLNTGGLLILGAGEDAQWKNWDMQRVKCPGVCAYIKIGGNI